MKIWERRPPTRPESGTFTRWIKDWRLFVKGIAAAFNLLWAGAFACAAESSNAIPSASISTLLQGRAVYQKNCVPCHGQSGDGRGDMGLTVKPRPRNFRAAVFKFRSTPSGTLPTDDDLARTIRGGLSGTAMPIFTSLREQEIRAVIAYVKSFSPRWEKAENYAASVPLPELPGWFKDRDEVSRHAQNGKPLFLAACAPCHGLTGDGRGSASIEMKDSFGEPVTPSDLRQPLRCGREPKDIYRTLVTGLDGTPMPSFFGAFSETQFWEISAYVTSLRRDGDIGKE
jgi:mono/diheme cytochrome c family protein